LEGCLFGFLPSSANPKTRYVVQQAKKGLSSLLERLLSNLFLSSLFPSFFWNLSGAEAEERGGASIGVSERVRDSR